MAPALKAEHFRKGVIRGVSAMSAVSPLYPY
jgi:hypothetical protein